MFDRWLTGVMLLLIAASPLGADDSFASTIAPFLKQHCHSCHGADRQEGGVRFDTVDDIRVGNRSLWTRTYEKVAAGEMPPKKKPQPDATETRRFLKQIEEQQRALGVGGARRLNRRELAASLRDVTGLAVDFSLALPGDGTVAGFDTGAEALQEASDSVAQWLVVTRRAVDGIRFLEPSATKPYTVDFREVKDLRKVTDAWKSEGVSGKLQGTHRQGVGLLIEPRTVGDLEELTISVPPPPGRQGVLRLTLDVSAMKPMAGLPNPRLWVRIGGRDLDYREIAATHDQPERLVYEVHLGDLAIQSKGVTIALSNKIEVPYAVEGFANEERSRADQPPVPGGTGLFRPEFDRKKLAPEQQPAPFIVLQKFTIEPDVVLAWPPPAWNANVGQIKDAPDVAERLLTLGMERAWRRPASTSERAPYVALYTKLRSEGMAFDPALRAAFQSVLLSAPFRYRDSPGHPDAAVAQHAIASRLSFMLVGEPPDAELRRLAAAGKMREPAVLDAQVDRLLADPRSQAFFRPFVSQWLEMEQPITIVQSHIEKQDFRFARHLKASMREETFAYVTRLVSENRPAGELVDSDWTMMNDALARHYGYPALEGGTLRKVTLRPDDPRGGILGHAGLQSMLCWMGENWVIYRGAWALRHILDQPPPPPPLEVPELNPSDGKNKGKPFRELLRQHQEDARCAVCHKSIDPIGFAFQNFDLSGRWRDAENESYARAELDGKIAWVGVGKTRPVDTAGNFPRGETFTTFKEFKSILVNHYQADMVRGLLKNLFVYAVGRKPGIDDMQEIAAIMDCHKAAGFPLRDLLKSIVRSNAFLESTAPPTNTPPADRSPR